MRLLARCCAGLEKILGLAISLLALHGAAAAAEVSVAGKADTLAALYQKAKAEGRVVVYAAS